MTHTLAALRALFTSGKPLADRRARPEPGRNVMMHVTLDGQHATPLRRVLIRDCAGQPWTIRLVPLYGTGRVRLSLYLPKDQSLPRGTAPLRLGRGATKRNGQAFCAAGARAGVGAAILPAPDDPVAVLLVTEHWGRAIHTLLWIQRLFPGRFRSVVLVGVVKVQADALGTPAAIQCEHERLDASLDQLEVYCWKAGLGTSRAIGHGTDTVAELERLVKDTVARHPGCVCFTNQLILPAGRRVGEWLHNQTALGLQRRLHLEGIPLVVLPITLR